MGHVTILTTAQGPKVIDKCESERYLHSNFTSEYTFFRSSWDLTSTNFKHFNTLKLQSSSEPILYLLVSSIFTTIWWIVLLYFEKSEGNKWTVWFLFERNDGTDDWSCLYYQQWLIYAICPLHGAKYKLNNIIQCPVGVPFYASCIILAQILLSIIRCYQRCKYSSLIRSKLMH